MARHAKHPFVGSTWAGKTRVTRRTATWIGGAVALLCCLSQVAAAALLLSSSEGWDFAMLLLLGYPVVGALIVSRQPRNTIGWLLVAGSASIMLGLLCAAVVFATLDAPPAPTTWQELLAWVTNIAFIGGFEGLLLTMAFLFPTGRFLSPRWRAVGLTMWLLFAASFIILALRPGPLGGYFSGTPEITNPFGVPGVDAFTRFTGILNTPLNVLVLLTSLWAMVARVRRARGIERLQLQWLALTLGLVSTPIVALLAYDLVAEPVSWVIELLQTVSFVSGSLGIAAAIGIAILRYQLYDIERLINRGLVYLALSVALALVYLCLVLVLGSAVRSLTDASSSLVTAAATLIVAALFTPLRTGIQHVVDRRFYRRKYDAARTIESFSARLSNEVDLGMLSQDLQAVVRESMQPAHVSLWLRPITPHKHRNATPRGRADA